jgi:hypothetical protein
MRPDSILSGTTRSVRAALAGALALGCVSTASAATLSNLSVFLDPGNTPDLLEDAGFPTGSQISSDVAVLASTGTAFTTRYQAGVYTDTGNGVGAGTNILTLDAAYTISFDVTDAVGEAWRLDLTTSRVGARTSVTDSSGESAFSLSAVTGFLGGAGTLSSGSLGLGAIARSQQGNSVNLTFDQSGTASITGSGNGSVTLSFVFSATSETIFNPTNPPGPTTAGGDEAAIRMGNPGTLGSFTAGNYPGSGGRDEDDDGHFIDLDLVELGPIPEPDTALLLGLGLGILAVQGRRRR